MNPQKKQTIIAVDIAKEKLDVRIAKETFQCANTPEGIQKICQRAQALENPLVVCEATGGYERTLLQYLHANNITVALISPSRIRGFALSEGIKAKTDIIDTLMIQRFAEEKTLRPVTPPTAAQEELQSLMDRRNHLTEMIAREKTRKQNSPLNIHQSIERIIGALENELVRIEVKIRKIFDSNAALKAHCQLLQSVVGVGEVTAWTVLTYLKEIGTLSRNQLVALAGLAPYNRDSGQSEKKRRILGGRAKVRKCLYMAAHTARTHNPVIKAYVDGLMERGKCYKSAMVAAMRKLLIHLQSLVKKQNILLET